jgi:hypothetical protein
MPAHDHGLLRTMPHIKENLLPKAFPLVEEILFTGQLKKAPFESLSQAP